MLTYTIYNTFHEDYDSTTTVGVDRQAEVPAGDLSALVMPKYNDRQSVRMKNDTELI